MEIILKFSLSEYSEFQKWLEMPSNNHYKPKIKAKKHRDFLEVTMTNEANIEFSIFRRVTNNTALKQSVAEDVKKGWWHNVKEIVRAFLKGIFIGAGNEAFKRRVEIGEEGEEFLGKVRDAIDDDDFWAKLWSSIQEWFIDQDLF